MHESDITWLIGGPQGGGIETSAETFARAALRTGLRVVTNREYHSNIMGEHSYVQVRVSDEDRHSLLDQVNVLVALDEDTLLGDPHDEFGDYKGHLHEVVFPVLALQPFARVVIRRKHSRGAAEVGDHVGDGPPLGDRQVGHGRSIGEQVFGELVHDAN